MNTKSITYKELESAVEISFREDKNIYAFYDPAVPIISIEQLVADILRKVKTYVSPTIKGVYEKGRLIGYFVFKDNMLISFSLSVGFRIRKYLRRFFSLICKELNNNFVCFLWKRNVRAIKWLSKNDMEVYDFSPDVVKLVMNK